jgi:hypothetical protein
MLVAPMVTLVHAVLQIWGGSANSRNGGSRISPDPRKPDRSANDRPLAA